MTHTFVIAMAKTNTYSRGDFSFDKTHFGGSLAHAYSICFSNDEYIDFLKNTNPPNNSYDFWSHPLLNEISTKLESDEHSGMSFAVTMRNMQFIAKNGWKNYIVMKHKNVLDISE